MMKKDDLDALLDDENSLEEDASPPEEEPSQVITIEASPAQEGSDDYDQVLARLSIIAAQDQVWLGIPSKDPVILAEGSYHPEYRKEISDCTHEEFVRWLNKAVPYTQDYKYTETDFDTDEKKKNTVHIVEEIFKRFYRTPIKIDKEL